MKIVHVITGLEAGGAETMLLKLITSMDRQQFSNEVVCLGRPGPMSERFEQEHVDVHTVGLQPARPSPLMIGSLVRHLRRSRPAIVQTWMYHADLIGTIVARLAGIATIVWNVRHNRPECGLDKRRTVKVAAVCARLSHRGPKSIVVCSESAMHDHIKFGYASKRFRVIPNGFDTHVFHPDAERKMRFRDKLGVDEGDVLIGFVGRFHPVKDHKTFIHAAAIVYRACPSARFVFCGAGSEPCNEQMMSWLRSAGIEDRSFLLGDRDDIPAILPALDVFALSSVSEGFPNALGEAMACGLPCVSTDVGDCALIMGPTGLVVPPRRPDLLGEALVSLVTGGDGSRHSIGAQARVRIEREYSLSSVVRRYEALYLELAASASPPCTYDNKDQ